MATIGNYGAALGGMAKDAVVGGAKGFVGGLKGAMISEAPGIAGAYAFGKDLRKRANSYTKMPAGGAAPSAGTSGASSPLGGFAQAVSSVAGGIRQGNVINIEQVRQLKQLNDNVANQSKLIAFQIADTKRKDQFAEEVAKEQANRDDSLLSAIKQLNSRDNNKVGASNSATGGGSNSFLGKVGDLISDNIGTLIGLYLGGKGIGAAGRALGGLSGARIGMAGRALPQGAVSVLDASGKVIAGAGARSALMEGIATVAPLILRFFTGPIGLGIMAAAGLFTLAAGARTTSPNDGRRRVIPPIDPTAGPSRKAELKQDEARALLEDANERAKSKNETARKNAERDLNAFGGRARVEAIANGKTDPGGAINSSKFLDKVRGAESGGRNIQNPLGGTAGGVYQITDSTWTGNVTKMIAGGDTRFTEADKNPKMKYNEAKARMVAEYITEQNRVGLKTALGKDPTETDLYMAYFLGMGGNSSGAIKFLKEMEKDPAQLAWKLSSDNADSDIINNNAEIFFEKVSRDPKDRRKVLSKDGPRSVKAVYDLMNKKISGGAGGNAAVLPGGAKPSDSKDAPKTKQSRPATKAEIDNKAVNEFYKSGNLPFETAGGGILFSKVGMPATGGEGGGELSGTKIVAKNAPIKTEDDKLRKVTENIAKQQGIDPKKSSATQTPTQKAKETARLADIIKPLYKSNTQLINETNQKFLQGFKTTATRAFTQLLTKEFLPNGAGVSFKQAQQESNYRGQQLQKIFGTQAASQKFATGLLGKTYGPMFAPLFNQMAQGYLEVGSRIAGKAIFQGIGGLGAEESQGIMGQVLGNYASGKKTLAFEQLLFGASGGRKSGIAVGMESLLAKYGFDNPAQGISYFAGGLADMATTPLANLLGGDTTNGVSFDARTGKYYNRDGSLATPAEYAAASRQYGASTNQGQLFSQGLNNYGGARQAGYNPYDTTQMQRGIVATGNQPGQFRVVAPSVNAITGVSTPPTIAQAFGLSQQQQAGLTKEQLDVQQAQLDLTRIEATKRAEEAKAKLISDAETRAQALNLEKDSAEYNRMVAAASDRGNAIVTMEAAKYTVSGLTGQGEGGGTTVQGQGALRPGDPGYREGQLFQNPTGGGKLSFGQEIGNFGFDVGKMMLGNKISQSLGIKNPYGQMVANFAIQKGLNYGFEALKNSSIGSAIGDFGSTIVDTGTSFLGDIGSSIASFFGFANGGIVTKATPGVFGEAGAEAVIPLANPTATKALSAAMGTDKTLSSLGDQTDLLSSIDKSLLTISGRSAGSGTTIGGGSLSSSGSFYAGSTSGLGGIWNPISAGIKPGVNAGKPGAPDAMDIVTGIATSMAKGYLIKTGLSMAANAIAPGIAYEMTIANLANGGGVSGAMAAIETGGSMLATGISSGVSSAISATGFVEAGSALLAGEGIGAALASIGPVGWAVLGVAALFSIFGGGRSKPPAKEPKFHAAIYVNGNNNIDAISPVYETTDYHAPPDVYKTIAYGLLRVAFNAAKAAEQVTKMTPPFDYLYIKVEFNRISLCWGKGAPNANTIATSDANQVGSWGPPSKDQNLNTVASDIVSLINNEFKKSASASNLTKLDTAAKALGNMTLDQLSSGLIQDLKTGDFKLDQNVQKGIFAKDVGESNRIASLISVARSNSGKLSDEGTPLIWSMKDNAYIDASSAPGALLLDAQGRPVYDIPGTSAGLTAEDFGGTDIVGIDRPANLYSPTTGTVASGSASGGTVISAPSNTKIDNSSVSNFYNLPSNSLDRLRRTGPG